MSICYADVYTWKQSFGLPRQARKKKVKFRAMANIVNKKMRICPIFLNDAIFITLPIKLHYYNKYTGLKIVGLV